MLYYLKGFAPMLPAPLVWKYGYEVARGHPGGSRRRPEALWSFRRFKNRSPAPEAPRGSKISLRTSELWRPDLGDLKVKSLNRLEDYSLVAKSRALGTLFLVKER